MVSRRRQQSLRKAVGFEWFVRLTAAVEHTALQTELVSCSMVESISDAVSAVWEVQPVGLGQFECIFGLVFSLMCEVASNAEQVFPVVLGKLACLKVL